MFPQIAETIYSPALTDISAIFPSARRRRQTLSVYFIGFAVGVFAVGRIQRSLRPASGAAGGVRVALGCLMALWATDFRCCWRRGSSRRWRGNRFSGDADGPAGLL
jgi:hypothetical protein